MAKQQKTGVNGRVASNGTGSPNGPSAPSTRHQALEASAKDAAAKRLIELAEVTLKVRVRLTDDGPRALVPTRDGSPPEEQPLRDGPLAALLCYHYAKDDKIFPPPGAVEAALRYLEGKALDERRTAAKPLSAELARLRPVVLRLARREGDLWSPAEKIREQLNALASEGDEFRGVKVPATADAVGKTLAALAGPLLMDDGILLKKEKCGDVRGWRMRDLSDLSGDAFTDASPATPRATSSATSGATSSATSGATSVTPGAAQPRPEAQVAAQVTEVDPDLAAFSEYARGGEGRS